MSSLKIPVPWISLHRGDHTQETIVMASRLELDSARHSAAFTAYSLQLYWQALRAPGNRGSALIAEPVEGIFWTLSAWEDEKAIRDYAKTNPHRSVMKRLRPWMKASRFETYPVVGRPTWREAREHLQGAPRA